MSTRDISGYGGAPYEIDPVRYHGRRYREVANEGRIYYQMVACDGWPTGPCDSLHSALERVVAYEKGEEVSEAAPGQASRAQMTAFHDWASGGYQVGHAVRDVSGVDTYPNSTRYAEVVGATMGALSSHLHSTAWMAASRLLNIALSSWRLPSNILNAGGAVVRRRMPYTAIPTRGP